MLSQQLYSIQTKGDKITANGASPNHLRMPILSIEFLNNYLLYKKKILGDSKRWTHFVSLYDLKSKRRLNTRQTVGCGIPSSMLALRVDLRGLRSKLSKFVSRSPLIHVVGRSFCFYTDSLFAQIGDSRALPLWRLNVETKTKRTLYSSRRLSFNELTNAKNLVLHSSHFALN